MPRKLEVSWPGKKYLLMPGKVQSKNDGQIHEISAEDLCRLYGVAERECLTVNEHLLFGCTLKDRYEGLYLLQPLYSGDYKIPRNPI